MLNKDKKEEGRNTQHTIKKNRRELTQEFIEKNSSILLYRIQKVCSTLEHEPGSVNSQRKNQKI